MHQILTEFQNSFTDTLSSKFPNSDHREITPCLRRVTTLLCEIMWDGLFDCEYTSERILKIGQYWMKLWMFARYCLLTTLYLLQHCYEDCTCCACVVFALVNVRTCFCSTVYPFSHLNETVRFTLSTWSFLVSQEYHNYYYYYRYQGVLQSAMFVYWLVGWLVGWTWFVNIRPLTCGQWSTALAWPSQS